MHFTADDVIRVCAEVSHFGRKAGYTFKGLPVVQWEFPTIGDFARAKVELLRALSPMMVGALGAGAWQRATDEEYDVWQQGLEGQAALARATQDRQIKVQEAEAARDSAKLLAEAEVIRSRGAAEANKIMQEGLGGPENFLRWKYISMLDEGKGGAQREIIYVPMDGVLPITEATRAAPIQKAPPIADKK